MLDTKEKVEELFLRTEGWTPSVRKTESNDAYTRAIGAYSIAASYRHKGVAVAGHQDSAAHALISGSVTVAEAPGSAAVTSGYNSVAAAIDQRSYALAHAANSVAVNTGESANALAQGWDSVAVVTRDGSKATAEGLDSLAVCTVRGYAHAAIERAVAMTLSDGFVSGVKGSILLYPIYENERRTGFASVQVDGETIKENTWYEYRDGKWKEKEN